MRVSGRDQFSLLVVRGDGTRVVRFNFTRPAAKGAFLGLVFSVAVVGTLVGDWVKLRELAPLPGRSPSSARPSTRSTAVSPTSARR